MNKKIYYFVESPFDQRDHDRFGVDILKKNGFDVEIWDFTPILRPNVYDNLKNAYPPYNAKQRLFTKKEQVFSAINEISESDLVIFILGYGVTSYFLYRAISKKDIDYCVFAANAIPASLTGNAYSRLHIIDKIKKVTPAKFIGYLYRLLSQVLLRNIIRIKPPRYILAGGEKSLLVGNWPRSNKSEVIWLHTLDYDIYLAEESSNVPVGRSYAVFLDEYLPFHPDYFYMKTKPYSTPDEYYPNLCEYFTFLEKELDIDVVIAAHPRANYNKHPDYFGGRKVLMGKTASLVKNARFVIAHSSTAINYAVLFKKTIIFITTDTLQRSPHGHHIATAAAQFGVKPINIDSINSSDYVNAYNIRIDENAYSIYKNNYIKKNGSLEKLFWQIFIDRIKKK
jgi:hypothetical protein